MRRTDYNNDPDYRAELALVLRRLGAAPRRDPFLPTPRLGPSAAELLLVLGLAILSLSLILR